MNYLDGNHRVIKSGDNYIPQFRPYLFRYLLFRWMGGWSEYNRPQYLLDTNGGRHKVTVTSSFVTEMEALDFLTDNKI